MAGLPKTIVFDLDGTLVDSAPDLTAALNHVLAMDGLAPVPLEAVRGMVGLGARKLIERGLAAHGANANPERVEERVKTFIDHYRDHIADASRLFPGVMERLNAYGAQGIKMGICTNKPIALSEALLSALDIAPYFAAVLGADSLPVRKPDPLHLLETITRLGGERETSVMVGDSMTDITTARNAKVPVVAVSFGYTSVPPADFAADALIDHFDDLDAALMRAHAERATKSI